MRILIADDHDLMLETLSAFLTSQGGFKVETVGALDDACRRIKSDDPYDLILLDYSMPGMNGLDGLTKALKLSNGCPVAIMSGTATKTIAQSAIDTGAIGFLPKTMAAKSVVNAIRFMAMGEVYIPLEFLNAEDNTPETTLSKVLSKRELEVLNGLCRGMSNKEIARELDLREVTIKLHVKTLCRKLDAKNRTHAAMIGKEAGVI